jgi:hypothetical protein
MVYVLEHVIPRAEIERVTTKFADKVLSSMEFCQLQVTADRLLIFYPFGHGLRRATSISTDSRKQSVVADKQMRQAERLAWVLCNVLPAHA